MDFRTDRPIYHQIVDYAYGCILSGEWSPGARVPSVREMAVAMAVNSHTVLKAYEHLQSAGIIAPRRGMGFFLADDAPERVNADRRRDFFDTDLPEMYSRMKLLGISIDDVTEALRRFSDG